MSAGRKQVDAGFAERKGNFQKEFQNFTEYILKKLDHSQEEAVMLGYELYRQAMQERESAGDSKLNFVSFQEGVDNLAQNLYIILQ